jgi:hypothetical protein
VALLWVEVGQPCSTLFLVVKVVAAAAVVVVVMMIIPQALI